MAELSEICLACLKPVLGEAVYARLRESFHNRSLLIVESFPYRYQMDRRAALATGIDATAVDELCRTISLFQWLLCGLMLNVTYFRLALAPRS